MQYMNSIKEGAAKAFGSKLALWSIGLISFLIYSYGLNEIRTFETDIVDTAVFEALAEITPEIEAAKVEIESAKDEIEAAKDEIETSVDMLMTKTDEMKADLVLYQTQVNIKFEGERKSRVDDMKETRTAINALTQTIFDVLLKDD